MLQLSIICCQNISWAVQTSNQVSSWVPWGDNHQNNRHISHKWLKNGIIEYWNRVEKDYHAKFFFDIGSQKGSIEESRAWKVF